VRRGHELDERRIGRFGPGRGVKQTPEPGETAEPGEIAEEGETAGAGPAVPCRPAIARPYRLVLARIEPHLPLPPVPPAVYTAASLLLSALFFFTPAGRAQIALLAVVLLADWLDGATARRYGWESPTGYKVDVVADRASEGMIFAAGAGTLAGQVFLALWALNIALVFYSLRTGRHRALALRAMYGAALVLRPWWPAGWA